jgi:hypothetical protein
MYLLMDEGCCMRTQCRRDGAAASDDDMIVHRKLAPFKLAHAIGGAQQTVQ